MTGTYVLSAGYYDAYYLKAQKVRQLISEDFRRAFEQVDVLMGPTSPTPAFKLGAKVDDPITMYLNDIYTIGANLAGLPGDFRAVRIRRRDLPVGLQIIGPFFGEAKLLNAAHRVPEGNRLACAGPRRATSDGMGDRHRARSPRAARDALEDLLGLVRPRSVPRPIRRPISSTWAIRVFCRCSTVRRCAWR